MECSCAVDIDNECGPDCSTVKIRSARIAHICCECGCVIKPEDQYEYFSGIWDGHPETYKTCLDCLSLRDVFFDNGYTFTQLWDDFYNTFYGEVVQEQCISKLTPKAREKVCAWIEEQWLYEDEE